MQKLLVTLLLLLGMNLIAQSNLFALSQTKFQKLPSKKPLGIEQHHQGTLPDTLGVGSDTLRTQIEAEVNRQKATVFPQRIKEALQVVLEIQGAVQALQKHQIAVARDSLIRAQRKLQTLLSRYPDVKFIPIDANVEVINLAAGPDTIKAARKLVKELIAQGKLQAARKLLDNLVSEIRVTTTYLPMVTFPEAVQKALQLIQQKQMAKARQVLEEALATLEIREYAIPLPVIIAESLVSAAAAIADSSADLAIRMLQNARRQLEIARLLGYSMDNNQYQHLLTQIDHLQTEIRKGHQTKTPFQKLKKDIREFKESFKRSGKRAKK